VALWPSAELWRYAVPAFAAILVAFVFTLNDLDAMLAFIAYFASQAAAILAAMWVFRRTHYWQRRTGIVSGWQFSVAHLLVVTTVVALLIVVLQSSDLWTDGGDDTAIFVGFIGISTTLAVAATYLWSLAIHAVLKLAGVTAIALALSAIFLLNSPYLAAFTALTFLIEAIVLSTALTLEGFFRAYWKTMRPHIR
jgi:hypothetical protein